VTVPIRALLMVGLIVLAGCREGRVPAPGTWSPAGDPDRGKIAIRAYGCHTCHTIPGVRGANAVVGPSLEKIAIRTYIAGHLPNTPENLIRWIQHPGQLRRPTAMPDIGVSDDDARDIAAYLYTLR
jgi:cytochrome c